MTTIYRATLTTRNFMFDAFGTTEDGARSALQAGLDVHARQYRLAADWFDPLDIEVREIALGVACRDREPLPVR